MELTMEEASRRSPFEQLPSDLLWKIIDYSFERVFHLRSVSRKIKSHVSDYAILRRNASLVDELGLSGLKDNLLTISISLRHCNSKLFKLRLIRKPSFNFMEHITLVNYLIKYKTFEYSLRSVEQEKQALEYLYECTGRLLGTVVLSKCDDQEKMNATFEILDKMQFKSLQVRIPMMTEEIAKHLEETIIRHEVDHLAIMTKTFSPAKPEIFLLLVSNLVRSLHICQQYDNWILKEDLYLWGSQNVDWAPIIVEMFKRKINKLLVENYHFPKYLSSNSVDFLRENLPILKKKIWFQANCEVLPRIFSYKYNEHLIQYEKYCDSEGGCLKIMHSSRSCEAFL